MLYIHDSVKNGDFVQDKKLSLLLKGVITIGQFVNLIEVTDPYTIIGPAVVAKSKISEFIQEWKTSQIKLQNTSESIANSLTPELIIERLPMLVNMFPELTELVKEFEDKLQYATCSNCVKNKYILRIADAIRKNWKDGRSLIGQEEFIRAILEKYIPGFARMVTTENFDEFDINWVKPDTLIGLGEDLIESLTNCFDCCKKHLGRAKAFYEEWTQGYPEHSTLMYRSMIAANKTLEEGYILYWDSLAQLDMASNELVGSDFNALESEFRVEMIELANEIRKARILFQENTDNVPDFNGLRISVQRLQNKMTK
jgi:hypothetical protein